MSSATPQVCSRCVYDATTPAISFDAAGVCNYCHMHDALERQYPTGPSGQRILESMADEIRKAGRGKPFDCVVGVSGGCDSSFMLHKAVELGLRPLAAHFDNTWNSPIATHNIYNVLEKLGVELYTLVVNNKEYDDLYRAFMVSGIKDIEAPTDIGLTSTLYMAAEKYGVRYIFEGHSFRTEGISPLGWIYMDGKLIESIHQRFGTRPMKTFPNLTMARFLRWAAWRGIKRIRPLYWVDYDKADAKRFLSSELGWEWYGGHHLENRFTAFYHTYWMPLRYGIDARMLGHAALVRSGQMERDEALAELAVPHEFDPDILALVKKRLRFSDEEFEAVMTGPRTHYSDFPTYKRAFERMRPLYWLLYKLDRVPQSFYMKFTRPDPSAPGRRRAPEAEPEAVHAAPGLHRAD